MRQSVGLPALPLIATLIAINTLARDTPWSREWLWATYQYHFTVVLYGPLVAGLATVEGARLSRRIRSDLTKSGGKSILPLAALYLWAISAYLTGLIAVLIWVKYGRMPGLPGLVELRSVVPPLALLAAQSAVGFAVGVRTGRRILAPVVSVAMLTLVITSYGVFGPANPLVVGGATASLVGLEPRLGLQAIQVVCFSLITCWVLLRSISTPGRTPHGRQWARFVLTVGVAGATVVLVALVGENQFEPREPALECSPARPTICVSPGYARDLPALRQAVMPYITALEAVSVAPPGRFEQRAGVRGVRAADIPAPLPSTGPPALGPGDVISWYAPLRCDLDSDPIMLRAFSIAYDWLAHAGAAHQTTSRVPTDQEFRAAIAQLADCRSVAFK